MPPRIPIPTCLRAARVAAPHNNPCLALRSFSATPSPQLQKQKRKHQDPYTIAQAKARKAANLSRQEVLRAERTEALGDPVKGLTTPFVESFDTGTCPTKAAKPYPTTSSNLAKPEEKPYLNYFLKPDEVQSSLLQSERLAAPIISAPPPANRYNIDALFDDASDAKKPTAKDIEAQRAAQHTNAATAIQRITHLDNGSSKDRLRVNIQRCIDMFGRHNTDKIMPPKAPSRLTPGTEPAVLPSSNPAAAKRAGPDTGSSEVQIAILTAKIRTLAGFLETRGKHDKVNKRNLRLLVHKRQKLLQYLRRKERGGPRWQHCISTLGLTEGTWRGEISL
ncbi:hypothetical protein K432DRAFT_353667 [Lepidopterella palustris CBS 459.81]|uniref:Ribosomal protein S15 n=1 Tax=Lepidopterella palustris CBS 459.81 TaxID=1314670 RepID=A0A8E2JF45_9PEZI|nr:hypothetical protein K432DRAFT_353667 [Lepidopterella palustris CBS 459.81]